MSRMKNSQRNIVYGFIGQFIKIFMKFIFRTIIIYMLGAEYLGLEGLFLNVISILSLVELGIGDAVCFALFKPIVNEDKEKINAYMLFYKKVYLIISFIILFLGSALIPFLKYLVNFDYEIEANYYLIYIMFFANSVLSYWFGAYRQVLLTANQQSYVINKVNNIILILNTILQLLVLVFLKSYYLYLLVMIVTGIIKNIMLFNITEKYFPYINKGKRQVLEKKEKKDFIKNIYAIALTKISNTIYTSSDNLIISAFIGTILVGYYSNYSYIITSVTGFISILFSSVIAGLGNINAEQNYNYMYIVFKRMCFINFWIYGFCFICFWQLLSPFIRLWVGNEYLLSEQTVLVIVLMFLIPGLNQTCTIYSISCGLFWQTRYRTLVTAIVNIVVSIILVQKLGLVGIFLGTIISYLSTTLLVDPSIIYKEIFKKNVKEFYIWYIRSFFFIILTGSIVKILCSFILITGIQGFIIQIMICVLVSNIIFYLLYRNDENLDYYKIIIKNMIFELKRK